MATSRQGDFDNFLRAVESQTKHFFASDFLNYARLTPVFLAQMTELEQKDPETFKALADGGLIAQLKDVLGVALYVDQNLEQKIKKIKAAGGPVGVSKDAGCRDCLLTTAPYLTIIMNSFMITTRPVCLENHQLTGSYAVFECGQDLWRYLRSLSGKSL